MKNIVLVFSLLLLSCSLWGQKKFVQGKVIDEQKEPVIGVTIMEKGTTNGTSTDVDGSFSIRVENGSVLVFQSLGYKAENVTIEDKTSFLNVVLREEAQSISEVVVVGYGTQKKVSVTGSISAVSKKDLLISTSPTLGGALAGKISGLTAIQGNGQPGADDVAMYLRGVGTTNDASPLVLIDGVPREGLRVIDPNEIESISVLKDASATAVFGVRGANGVIIITTKRGSVGKTDLSVSAVQSWSTFTRRPSKLSSLEYMALRNEAFRNDGYSEDQLPYQPDLIAKFENPLLGLDPSDPDYAQKAAARQYMYCSHDYYGELTTVAPQTKININATGGTEKLKYFINANYLHQGSNFKHESSKELGYDPSYRNNRFGFRTNLDAEISKSLKAFLNIGSYIETAGMPAQTSYLGALTLKHTLLVLASAPPIMPGNTTIAGFGVPEGESLVPSTIGATGFELLGRLGFREETRSSLNSTFGLDWDLSFITPGLSHKAQVSFDYFMQSTTQGNQYLPMYDIILDYDNDTFVYSARRESQIYLSTWKSAFTNYNVNMQYAINYNRTFGRKHAVGGMFLAQRDNWEIGYSTDSEKYLPYNVIGIASRFTYGYDDRYMLEVNMGYNGSEQFAKEKRFGFFPAVSGAWVLSNEKFLQENKAITNLKLRASYGTVGNDKIGDERFLYLTNIALSSGGLLSSLSQGQKITEGRIGNENVTWETAQKQNYGIDLQLFKDISLVFDVFQEHRTGILISREMVPALQGVPLDNVPKANLGIVDNAGFEIELGYNKALTEDLSIMIKSNFSYAKNKVKYYDEAKYSLDEYPYEYRITGQSIGQQWGLEIDYSNGNGYFNTQEELDNYLANYATYEIGTPRLGDFKYVDANKDGKINTKDYVPIGYSPVPRINYGLSLACKYKQLDASVFFQGVAQVSNFHWGGNAYETNTSYGSYYDYQKTAWTQERYESGQKITYPALSTGSTSNHIANSFFIMDKSYCRLRNVEIGYTLENLKRFGIENARFSVNGQNLLLFTNFKMKHVDPELTHQMDYPLSKTISVGVNVNF